MDAINAFAVFFDGLLAHAHFLSITLGMLIASGVAQWAKYPIRRFFYNQGQSDRSPISSEREAEFHRWCIRTIAGVVAFTVTFATWPDSNLTWRIVWSCASAALTPITYLVFTHIWPWLGERATADRGLSQKPPTGDMQ